MATVLIRDKTTSVANGPGSELRADISTTSVSSIPPLGEPLPKKRFWLQRTTPYDPDAIATQMSVFDDPETAKRYQPPPEWENTHRFDPLARWTWREEFQLVRKIDFRIMVWTCIMFMALELDRANLSQALTDNFLPDLGLTTNDYNLGVTIFRLSFLCAELPSQLVSKWMGPDRWIPMQMSLWSIVAALQFFLSGRASFLVCRSLLGVLQGGFIPDVILYLSYFYKHHELTVRLAFFWTAMSIADICSALLAYGILHMRGVHGHSGWRWLFLLEGLLTLIIGLLSFLLMPAGPCQTASWFRGKKGWFTEREETIIVNRVLRDDPSKSDMHNRQPITFRLLWRSLKDFDLWPLYILGLTFQIPMIPPAQYLTLTLRQLGFDTFQTNLLAIPNTIGHIITMVLIAYLSEAISQLTLVASLGQLWALPFLIYLNAVDTAKVGRWVIYVVITLLLCYPNPHPIQVAWNSRNSNTVRSRTVSAACYNMFVQASSIIASNIYRQGKYSNSQGKQASRSERRGAIANAYYVFRNRQRDKKWNAMTPEERLRYLATTTDQGNKRLDFRFHH
ncbi:hypothetical protein VTH06DRAFT_4067 [Thermothelomyces fergusii]